MSEWNSLVVTHESSEQKYLKTVFFYWLKDIKNIIVIKVFTLGELLFLTFNQNYIIFHYKSIQFPLLYFGMKYFI